MVKWTNEQRSAFESRNQNLLLSAAAGSGKTAVLVQRIVSLIIDDKVPINKMLIITFTKAAAGEMRERILEALSELMNEKDIDKSFIRKQITMINNSNISTIHAFCMEVIKRNFHNIDIDPSFRILDTTEKELLFIESINEVLEIEYEIGQSEFITLVESYTSNRNDEKLILIIESIYKFIRSKPHPFDWLEEKVELYNIDKDNIDDHIWVKALKKIIIKELKISKKYLDEAMIISEEINGPLEYGKTIKSDLEIIYNLKELINNDVSMFYNEINNISYQRLASIPKKRKEEIDPELIKLAKQLRDNSKKTIKKLSDKIGLKSFNQQIGDTNKLYATIKYLVGIIKKVDIQFRDKKLEKNSVDFNDLEQFALELLRDNNISNKYREKFDYIFVDEYQDTNIIQEEIVNLIKRDNNVFLVGDVKQSIYKFRLAEPELFLSKYESFSISEKADNRRINLSKNFRTRVEILDGINYIFKDLMTKEFGEIEYNKDAYLYKGMEFENINNPNVEINIINIDKKSASIEEVDQELLDLKTSEIEAKAVIQRIRALIDTETYDKKLKKIRKIEYRDIVILMRATSNWGPIYEEVFMREGIPLYYEGGTGYLQTLEIEIFLNLLKVIDNKRNDVSLLSVMRSPIGEFSINEMIEIRLEFPNKNYFDSLNEISKNDSKLGIKANLFIKKLNEWYKISKYLEIDEFIEKLLFDTNFINYVSAMPGGNIRRGNLKLLINKAKVFSESSITGLFYFIKFIQRIDNINVDFDTANVISENENVVRLMSIHKSKGLEFPVVIIARSNRQMVSQESKNDFVMHKDYGVGANYIDYEKRMKSDTISRWVINKKKNEENLAEEMRILYVAMTRSIDRLILFGTYSKGFLKSIDEWTLKNSKEFLDTSKSYIDWIMKIISRNKGCKTIYEIADKEENCDENDLFTVNVIELKDIEKVSVEKKKNINEIKRKLVNGEFEINRNIEKIFNYEYKSIIQKSPIKVSVTDMKILDDEKFENFKLFNNIPQMQKEPKFITEKVGMSPFDIGNTYHFIMEKINLKDVTLKGIEEQIDRFVEIGYIDNMQKEILNIKSIFNFYNSDIGKRLLISKEVKREIAFTYKYRENLLVQGIIDLYFEEDKKLIVIDYKTDKINSSNELLLVNEHKKQLEIYADALEKLTNKEVFEKYLYFFKNNKFYKV